MCLAIPGKIIEILEERFIVDYGDEKREANFSVVDDLKAGDYVVVSNKIIIAKIPRDQAIKYLDIINKNA